MHDRFPSIALRRPFAFALIPALIMLAVALPAALAQQPEEKFQRSFTMNPGGTLRVENYKGTIHVTGSSTSQLVVKVVKRFEGGSESGS